MKRKVMSITRLICAMMEFAQKSKTGTFLDIKKVKISKRFESVLLKEYGVLYGSADIDTLDNCFLFGVAIELDKKQKNNFTIC